ncbi:DUF2795 domain-containing protein [Microtetraspora malaysiensis]|uniref:DUF2795 domain-containing protein n=1 Tax=Microtetraspora malaysiensis TaxID=161358 RepID=A0ABW6SX35_9ACTN|nr:DUF2795 domain-containing protein [Microtetraspora malaysiensis]
MATADPVHVSEALSAFPYPGTREQLVRFADRTGADESVVTALTLLPAGRYANSAEVMRAVAGDDTGPGH